LPAIAWRRPEVKKVRMRMGFKNVLNFKSNPEFKN
jgi:hypothetical protein